MTSVYFDIAGLRVSAHLILETLAYSIGFQVYLRTRGRWQHAPLPFEKNAWILIGCIFGALFGSKLLNILDAPLDYWEHRDQLLYWVEGKTVVGGLLGGWIGVEIAKKYLGVTHATGDAYVFPLIVGIVVGRVGCFLNGLEDKTYGTATSLPWGVDFGDGIVRHPAQLYEIGFLLLLAFFLYRRMQRPYVNGYIFRLFIMNYLAFRFLVEFVKPRYEYLPGISMIQVAALLGVLFCARIFLKKSPFALPPSPALDEANRS